MDCYFLTRNKNVHLNITGCDRLSYVASSRRLICYETEAQLHAVAKKFDNKICLKPETLKYGRNSLPSRPYRVQTQYFLDVM
jgi:hypothetical protein